MARDYAKRSQGNKSRRTSDKRKPAKRTSNQRGIGIRAFFAGVLTGVFASFILYLGTLDPGIEPTREPTVAAKSPGTAKPAPKPRFDFYKRLREQTIDVEVEPAPDLGDRRTQAANNDLYVLQAGSFRQREDADRRRAELFLLSLEPSIEETQSDNGRWFRVYLGPFETRSEMAKARSLTANQDIDTLLLRREAP